MHQHAQVIFVFLVEMGFHHVGQAGLKRLTSGDLPISASQCAGITSVSHCTRPMIVKSLVCGLLNFMCICIYTYRERERHSLLSKNRI
uniref:Uncharacterized protein n=1 Tax=Macaca fascicularis TaxID=9541 RepID=A0A7N9C9U1_MACFA